MDRNTLGSSFNKLAHAQSTPVGMDGTGMSSKTPPLTPRKSGKMLAIPVLLLDDTTSVFQVQSKANGRVLFEQVCKQLNLLESDYFGLEYQHSDAMYWLDLEKPLHRQVGLSLVNPTMKFCVKFYTPDPSQLEEEYTRYLFCLQIKRDLMQGDLQCNDNTAALIISYIVQAECGDYASEDYPDHTYLSSHKFVPHQDKELEFRIMENHKKHVGQSPAEADLNLLETARRCECYGMKMHPAKDQENVLLNLAVAHMGIVVFQNYTKINTFSWAKIRKISFKRKRFLIKLHPEGYGYYKDVVEFLFSKRDECKSFWKKCVENHTFFRCAVVKPVVRQKPRVLTRGSSFRYSGRTQKQIVQYVRENYVKRQTFQRSQSLRHPNSVHSSSVNVGTSISAHPLLPLGDKTTAGSGASLSCGSMTLSGSQSPTTRQAVGPQVAMTTTTTTTSAINQIRQQQIPADVYEPITTSSDITSIASSIQSPQHVLPSGQERLLSQTIYKNSINDLTFDEFQNILTSKMENDSKIRSTLERAIDIKDNNFNRSIGRFSISPLMDDFESREYDTYQSCFTIDNAAAKSIETPTKVYSSSYPGTATRTDSEERQSSSAGVSGGCLIGDTKISQDDISHDSYELLEPGANYDVESIGSNEEMFVMDNDYETVSKHILWREGSSDVEKRLGYVEPRYRNIGFSEFNEICKRGFASRSRIISSSHGFLQFNEFDDTGTKMDDKKCVHECVSRAKSDPYMMENKNKDEKMANYSEKERLKGNEDLSKSAGDIPYTLRKRNAMNGTARNIDSGLYNGESSRSRSDEIPTTAAERPKLHQHTSQDSGLSLSLEDNDGKQELKNPLLTKNYETVVTTSKSTKLMTSSSLEKKEISDDNKLSVEKKECDIRIIVDDTVLGQVEKNYSSSRGSSISLENLHQVNKRIVKVRSVEVAPKKSNKNTGKIRKSKSADSYERRKVPNRSDSVKGGRKEVIVIDSDDDSKYSKKSDGSDDVIILGYKSNKRRKFGKKLSSGSRDSQAEEGDISSFDVGTPKTKRKDIRHRSRYAEKIGMRGRLEDEDTSTDERSPFSKDSIKIKFIHKAASSSINETSLDICKADLSPKTEIHVYEEEEKGEEEKIEEKLEDEIKKPEENSEKLEEKTKKLKETSEKLEENTQKPEGNSKKLEEKPIIPDKKSILTDILRSKSPVSKLGLSEGSATQAGTTSLTPSPQRRAKSLDAAIIPLYRLPPVTSFSSKDDTLDEESEVMRCVKTQMKVVIPDEPIYTEIIPKKELENTNLEETPIMLNERKRSLPLCTVKSLLMPQNMDIDISSAIKGRSKSDGSCDPQKAARSTLSTPERKSSTRQERLDSFKKLKNFSIELWESEELEARAAMKLSQNSKDDDVFSDGNGEGTKKVSEEVKSEEVSERKEVEEEFSDGEEKDDPELVSLYQEDIEQDKSDSIPRDLTGSPIYDSRHPPPQKRSFDEDPSTSSSIKPELSNTWKPFPLESSTSSSVEESILPPDYVEESPEVMDKQNTTESSLVTFPASSLSFPSTLQMTGFFALSRTLSRISERSTTSERERSEMDDDSGRMMTRSLSVEEPSVSSEQNASFSSDPPSGLNLDNVFDEDDMVDGSTLPFPPEDLVMSPVLSSSEKTPLATNMEDPLKSEDVTVVEDEDSDNKTFEGEEGHPLKDMKDDFTAPRGSIGDDTSAGITVSDFSSSTGTTIKAHSSNVGKSEDNSLAVEVSEIAVDPVDEVVTCGSKPKFLKLPCSRSFDEYDSPYTESEDTPSSPIPRHILRKPQPPPPQFAVGTIPFHSEALAKIRSKVEKNRAKILPLYTSSSMSTSMESPTSVERKFSRTVAREKCYSYYSLARSPSSDGSSSSLEAPETPLTPNTIPRASKRKRHPPVRRRHRAATALEIPPRDYSSSRTPSTSTPSSSHSAKYFQYPQRKPPRH